MNPSFRIKARARRVLINLLLGKSEFAVVSNNCWGAHLYIESGRRFTTPFVGLFLTPDSYLALLRSWHHLMLEPLEFIDRAKDPKVEEMRSKRAKPWPVGRLGSEVEIQFMHYENANEAKTKWNRRVARMPKDPERIFFKFDDRDKASEQQLLEFSSLPLRKKVMFCGKHKTKPGRVTIPEGSDSVPDGLELSQISRRYFDACAWISGRKMRPGSLLSLL